MRRAALLLLLLVGCAPPKLEPQVLVRLSVAPQACAGRDGTTPVLVYVDLQNLPPQAVRVVVNGEFTFFFYGDRATLELERVGVGLHQVEVYLDGFRPEPYTMRWSVWECTTLR